MEKIMFKCPYEGTIHELVPVFNMYSNKTTALSFFSPQGEPYIKLSTNLEREMEYTCIWIKHEQSYMDLANLLCKMGLLENTYKEVKSGYQGYYQYKICGELLQDLDFERE